MDADDELHDEEDGPLGRSTSGSPVAEPGHRLRNGLISFSPDIAAWIAKIMGSQNLDT
jgi:hypothetical protein